MLKMVKIPIEEMGFNFIPSEYLPKEKDEYHLRNKNFNQQGYRALSSSEIGVLEHNGSIADDWKNVRVKEGFDPDLVKRVRFRGLVRIGKLEPYYLEFNNLKQPVGLYDSTIVSSDFGDNVSVNHVGYIAHYQVSDEVILFNVKEIITTSAAKFGNGILKEGESPNSRIQIELSNENAGRSILPFNGILPSDIFLWSKFKDDKELQQKFLDFTNERYDTQRGHYGKIGTQTIIKNSLIIKDVLIGEAAYIKGANKLKNLTINSSKDARTQIGEGVEAVNGIISLGCRVFYGSKAVRFVMGQASQLKYGARLINSYLGDNSTISCCEVLNSFIYPFHEQHHNNSFLCAATLLGQTNLAAGATVGSNHNSRAADGEILAGRGFWPGLCVSLKHNSKFASFVLISKGDFPAELDIKLPFSLVSNHASQDALDIMPAYWFMYNMYALARNTWKYSQRDHRTDARLHIEQHYLAPDSVNEMIEGMKILEQAVGRAYALENDLALEDTQQKGKELLNHHPQVVKGLEVLLDQAENSGRKVRVLKCAQAYQMYKRFAVLYGIENLMIQSKGKPLTLETIKSEFGHCTRKQFVNLGGQLTSVPNVNQLKADIKNGTLNSWNDVHASYLNLQDHYPLDKTCHAVVSMLEVMDLDLNTLTQQRFEGLLAVALEVKQHIKTNTLESRQKDYTNPFRKMMYNNPSEMDEVIGKLSDNDFIQRINQETTLFMQQMDSVFHPNSLQK